MSAPSKLQTHDELIDHLKAKGILQSPAVEAVMRRVDRAHYTGLDPYVDAPQDIGFNAEISAPFMHAIALQHLEVALRHGSARSALDVGAGSGYVTSCMALMQGDAGGVVVGVEHIPELAAQAEDNIRFDQPRLMEDGRVRIIVGDGRMGYPGEAPFDAIHVGAAVDKEHGELTSQLAPGGCMVVPVGEGGGQRLHVVNRAPDGKLRRTRKAGVSFVPLTDAVEQWTESDRGRRRGTPPPRRSHLIAVEATEEGVESMLGYVQPRGSRHSDARLSDARLSDARYSDARYSDARYSGARYSDARHSDVRHSDARPSDVRHSDVRHSNVRHSNVRQSDDDDVAEF